VAAVCVDIDNVIAQTDEVIRKVIRDYTEGRVQLAYANIAEFDYHKCTDNNGCSISKEQWEEIHELFSEPRYLWLIQPVPGVQAYLTQLAKKFTIHLVTSRLAKARHTTVEWLDNYGFRSYDLHFLKHGEKHVLLSKFAAAVEDHYEQATAFAQSGTPCYLIEHPWNKSKPSVENVHWVESWEELVKQLLAVQ